MPDLSPQEAIALQRKLANDVIAIGMPDTIRLIAGIDLAFSKFDSLGFCAIILLEYPELAVVEEQFGSGTVSFPYIPGLLSFREGPLFLETFKKLKSRPDLLIFDGQGIAHPRRLGIASHMGVLLDIPAIGCAKSRLYGTFDDPAGRAGSRSYLRDADGTKIGTVLRTRDNVRPVFVSPGHRVGIDESAEIIMNCVRNYRIPLPTRIADIRVKEYKRSVLM